MFSDTIHGARASANMYSLIETAKANDLEPYAYLRRVFTELPAATTVEDIEALLPWALPDHQKLGNDGLVEAYVEPGVIVSLDEHFFAQAFVPEKQMRCVVLRRSSQMGARLASLM